MGGKGAIGPYPTLHGLPDTRKRLGGGGGVQGSGTPLLFYGKANSPA